jgi:hypothetical protein
LYFTFIDIYGKNTKYFVANEPPYSAKMVVMMDGDMKQKCTNRSKTKNYTFVFYIHINLWHNTVKYFVSPASYYSGKIIVMVASDMKEIYH